MDWNLILKRDGPAVWRTAYRILGNNCDADDCFQEATMNAVEISRRESIVNITALLKRLAASRAIDRLRQRYRQRVQAEFVSDLDELPGVSQSPAQLFEVFELHERLRVALTIIPPNQACAFCLCCLEGLSYRECGESLSLSAEAIGVLIQRARKNLQSQFGDQLRDRSIRLKNKHLLDH